MFSSVCSAPVYRTKDENGQYAIAKTQSQKQTLGELPQVHFILQNVYISKHSKC